MTQAAQASLAENPKSSSRLMILLAMAMFVLVVDTSLMNVSISAVVDDLDATVSGVQTRHCAGSAGLRLLYSDREQDRRPVRQEARLYPWACWGMPSGR